MYQEKIESVKYVQKNEIGDEFHYLFICNDIPKKNAIALYFYRNPNIYKFEQLLNTKNKICRFIKTFIERVSSPVSYCKF